MIALRVTLNGKILCTAGAEDLAVLNTIVNAVGTLGALTKKQRNDETADLYLSVGGLTGRRDGSDEHLRWTDQQSLHVGDRIEVEILDAAVVDRPTITKPLDIERQQQKERERYEYAREVYHALRDKYDSGRV